MYAMIIQISNVTHMYAMIILFLRRARGYHCDTVPWISNDIHMCAMIIQFLRLATVISGKCPNQATILWQLDGPVHHDVDPAPVMVEQTARMMHWSELKAIVPG